MYVLLDIEALTRNHCCRGKTLIITYSEIVSVAVVIQHAKRLRLMILSSVACLALCVFFQRFLINGTIFGEVNEYRILFSLEMLSETFLILKIIQRDIILDILRSSCKVPIILVRFEETQNFSADFLYIIKYKMS
jgi:hypothetical protein